jgi:hypothetical protein
MVRRGSERFLRDQEEPGNIIRKCSDWRLANLSQQGLEIPGIAFACSPSKSGDFEEVLESTSYRER